jgi:acyl carrier protein
MTDIETKLRVLFAQNLAIPEKDVVSGLRYNERPEWDSVAHLALVAAIEKAFDIMLDTSDVLDMSSFEKAQQIVAKYVA